MIINVNSAEYHNVTKSHPRVAFCFTKCHFTGFLPLPLRICSGRVNFVMFVAVKSTRFPGVSLAM